MIRVLFGDHATQAPAIAACIDRSRYLPAFGFDGADMLAFDMVVPLSVPQFDAAHAANRDGRVRAVLPRPDLVALCDDKLLWNRWLIDHGFAAHVPALLGDESREYPYIRKSRQGDWGAGCTMVRTPADAAALPPIDPSAEFEQRAVSGEAEYVLHLLRMGGRIRFQLCYRYEMGDALAVRGQGQAARATVPDDPGPALPLCEAVLAAQGFEGLCCFNYKLQAGTVQFLECNPRFGGSLSGEVTRFLDAQWAAIAGLVADRAGG